MIAKTVEYIDYNGNKRTETMHFNLNRVELLELDLAYENGFAEYAKSLLKENDTAALFKLFQDLILKAYGEKSTDGRYFAKFDEAGVPLRRNFSQTEAYATIFAELTTDAQAAANFINGIVLGTMKPTDAPTSQVAAAPAV